MPPKAAGWKPTCLPRFMASHARPKLEVRVPNESRGTPNIEHPTPNVERQRESSLSSAFEVRCWTFDLNRHAVAWTQSSRSLTLRENFPDQAVLFRDEGCSRLRRQAGC